MSRIVKWCVTAAVILVAASATTYAHAENRTALVIGNGDYLRSPLINPVNDAKDMAAALRDLGFDVILRTNQNRPGMQRVLSRTYE